MSTCFERDGFRVVADVVEEPLLDAAIADAATDDSRRGGLRDLLAHSPAARVLARHARVREIAEAVLGPACFVTRAILFDKTAAANWKVAWHQDQTIAVRRRCDVAGFGPWSTKAGIVHVQPPAEVLERMLAVRVHLDDCGPKNGPLRVIPGSHRFGRLTMSEIEARRSAGPIVECPVARRGVMAFRPLLLHASGPAVQPSHRRVVHFEFAAAELPTGLEWHTRL